MRYWFNSLIITVYFLSGNVNLAAQNFTLPAPMKIIPVEKLDFVPDANNSCVSVEGPEIVKHEDNTSETVPDAFTNCALTLFEPLLNSKFKNGTQKTAEAIDALAQCSKPSMVPKHLVLVGHGGQGYIATGNGTNPQKDQDIDIGTMEAIDKLRSLTASELVLFGCETGAGDYAMQLLNTLAQQKFTTRARNGIVMCSLDITHNGALKGLYVLKGTDQLWSTAQPNELLARSNNVAQPVDLDPDSCFALKGPDGQFKVMAQTQFLKTKQHKKISLFDFQSESALRGQVVSDFDVVPQGVLTQERFHQFLAQDSELLASADFCQVLRPDLVPDRNVIGTFTLEIDGKLRKFYELRGGLVQDAEHNEVYYRAKTNGVERLHERVLEENERLLRLQTR